MLRLLRAIPWWFYMALVLLVVFTVMELRIRSAERRAAAVEQRVEDAKLDTLKAEREKGAAAIRDLVQQRQRDREALASLRVTVEKAAQQVVAAEARTAGVAAAGKVLEEHGTVDEIVASLRAHGFPSAMSTRRSR